MPVQPAHRLFATAKLTVGSGGPAIQNAFTLSNFSGPTDNPTVYQAVTNFLEDVYGNLVAHMSDAVDFAAINFNNVSNQEVSGDLDWNTLTTGSNVNQILPLGVAFLVLFRTGISRHVGKKYFGGFCENNIADSIWDGTIVTDMAAAALAARTSWSDPNGVSFAPVVIDRATQTPRGIVGHQVQIIPAYQRRRRQGAGI